MAKFARAILHIGTEKTGSTTIQCALARNRRNLAVQGFYVPETLCSDPLIGNHDRLTTYALLSHKFDDDLRKKSGITSDAELEIHRIEVYADLLAELSTFGNRSATVLLTNEHCHSRLVEPEEVGHLHSFLSDFFERITVLVYLRPQHELALSLYDQALRGGYYDIQPLPDFVEGHSSWVAEQYFDYADLMQRWAAWFGAREINVRIFSPAELLSGDVLEDYLAVTVGSVADFVRPPNLNPSIGGDLQPVLNAINRAVGLGQFKLTVLQREKLIGVLHHFTNHARVLPSRSDAESFFRRFGEGNERIREVFRPDLQSLFQPDFSRYDERQQKSVSELAQTLELVMQLVAER